MCRQSQPLQPRRRQDDRVHLALSQLAQPRVHIAAKLHARHIRPLRLQLRLPPQTARSDARSLRQRLEALILHRNKRIPRIDTLRDRRNRKRRGQLCRQILQTMHGQIDAPRIQRLLDLFREHPLRIAIRRADLGKRHMLHRVAQRLDDLDRNLMTRRAQPIRNVMRLPQRELRPARANAQHASL